MTKAIV